MKIVKNIDLKTNTFLFGVLFENINLIEFQKITSFIWINFIYINYLQDSVIDKFETLVFPNSVQVNLFITSLDELDDYDVKLINFIKNNYELLHD